MSEQSKGARAKAVGAQPQLVTRQAVAIGSER